MRMRGAILQITVNNNLPPSAPLPSLKQCFIAFSSICICHPRGPLFDLSPPLPASPGSRWPVDWQLWSDIWWDEASTTAPWRGGKRPTCGFIAPPSTPPTAITSLPEQRVIRRSLVATRCRKVQANGQLTSRVFDEVYFPSLFVSVYELKCVIHCRSTVLYYLQFNI